MRAPAGYEPTMEEVLASIRRIIGWEDDADMAEAVLRECGAPGLSLSSGALIVEEWGEA